jgi:hypothetical protein
VVVDDLDIMRVGAFPAKADPPLIVHANTALPSAIPFELLQPVAGRNAQVIEAFGGKLATS